MKAAVIIVAGSQKQNTCFWPSYENCRAGYRHDLIVVHRNMAHVPNIIRNEGETILENKCNPDGSELPHKAFGAYRHYWNKYKNDYDFFAFISDDVILKRDNWLLKPIALLDRYDRLGVAGTQVFNGNHGEYPHPSHVRAPIWFSKSDRLAKINWAFESDHEGEMTLADHFLAAGMFTCQIGHKIDFAYDALENGGAFEGDHISALFEKQWSKSFLFKKYSEDEINTLDSAMRTRLTNGDDSMTVSSPFGHIGVRRVISQLQPFDGLVLDKGLELARPYTTQEKYNIHILR